MTTDVCVRRVDNAWVENDVLWVLPPVNDQAGSLAGVTWCLVGLAVRDAHLTAAREAVCTIRSRLPQYGVYMLAGHTVAQPDTRVVRYRKLWASLAARGLSVPGEDLGEYLLSVDDGVRCFGLRRLTASDIDYAVALLEEERAAILIAIPKDSEDTLKRVILRGWAVPERHPDSALIAGIAGDAGIVLWTLGSFDDREAGLAGAALPEVLDELMAKRCDH